MRHTVYFFLFILSLFLCGTSPFSKQEPPQIFVSATKEDGKNRSFNDLIAQFKGKVVYIDFWASWCGPCIMEMPYSEKLHEKFAEKEIVFLYISLDKDAAAWQKGLKRVKNKGYHFLPSSPVAAQIAKDFNISSIPRYMIADKSGKIVVKDAPRPSNEKAAYDIEKHLNKK
jgi:thiol-disulfide isomerase/thioredoxin